MLCYIFAVKLCQTVFHPNRWLLHNKLISLLRLKYLEANEDAIPRTKNEVEHTMFGGFLVILLALCPQHAPGVLSPTWSGCHQLGAEPLHYKTPFMCIFSNQPEPAAPRTIKARDICHYIAMTGNYSPIPAHTCVADQQVLK